MQKQHAASKPSLAQRLVVLSLIWLSALSAGGFIQPQACRAALVSYGYEVNLGTSPLSGPFRLDLFLDNGGTAGTTGANTGVFNFGFGGLGDSSPALDLSDVDGFVPVAQRNFTPGDNLNFNIFFDFDFQDAPAPDGFSFSLFDVSANDFLQSSAPDGTSFTTIDLFDASNGGPVVQTFAGSGLDAPTVTATAPVPEPETWAMMGMGLAALLALSRRHRKEEVSVPTSVAI